MALQDILNQIQHETEEEIKKLNRETEEQIKKIQEKYAREKQETAENLAKKTGENIRKIEEKTLTLAKMEAKNSLLHAKRKKIDEAFAKAIQTLTKSDHYVAVITGLLTKVGREFKTGTVIPARGKETETKTALEKAKVPFKLAEESADFTGGFIFKSEEKIEINNSFEAIVLKQLKPDLEIQVAKILF